MSNPIMNNSFPSVLVYGTLASFIGIASALLISSLTFSPMVGA